jgi:ParB/RepB/Spo0J family partition protein
MHPNATATSVAKAIPNTSVANAILDAKAGPVQFPAKAIPVPLERDESQSFIDGLHNTTVVDVPLEQIDLADVKYQCRFQVKIADIRTSLASQGQEELVHLTDSKPHRIIDGFRRVTAMKELGWKTVKAIVHHGISDEKAHEIAYTTNATRKNLRSVEIAHSIVLSKQRGQKDDAIAAHHGMSMRQLQRYERLLAFPKDLQELVDVGEVSMAHAAVLAKFDGINLVEWVEKALDKKWSADELRRELSKSKHGGATSKPRTLIKVGHEDCRLLSRCFSKKSSTNDLTDAIGSLERCTGILRGWLAQRVIATGADPRPVPSTGTGQSTDRRTKSRSGNHAR